MKMYLYALVGLLTSITSLAQDVASQTKSFSADPINHPQFLTLVISLLGAVVFILLIVVTVYMVTVIRLVKAGISQASSEKEILVTSQPRSRAVFQAYKLPLYSSGGLLILLIIIVLSVKVISASDTQAATQLAAEVVSQPNQPTAVASTPEANSDEATIGKGRQVFENNNCGSCHRNDGGGNTIGPNLTDEFWLHGGDAKSICTTIQNGVAEKGMPAWANILTSDNIRDVTSYVLSLQGTNPPDAKAPQGEKFIGTRAAE